MARKTPKSTPTPSHKAAGSSPRRRFAKLSSFVKALKAGAASVTKRASRPSRRIETRKPAAAPTATAASKPIAKRSVVRKPARKPILKATLPARPIVQPARKVSADASPVRFASVVKKPARGPAKRAAKRFVERRRTPRSAATPSAAQAAKENFPILPFEAAPAFVEAPSRSALFQGQEPAFSIPSGYGDNRIVLMIKDPWWLHAYWEIHPSVERSARAQLLPSEVAGLQIILRVYDVTGRNYPQEPANRFFDISLSGMANNWYIKTDAPGRSFVVEIGLLTNTERFLLLARSNRVTAPRYGPSDVIDEEWVATDEDYWRLFGAASGVGLGSSQPGGGISLSSSYFSGGWSSANLYGMNKASSVKGFWCRVNADLIIHGVAEPRAVVKIQGQPVAVRKDGTFSIRLALPEGTQTLTIDVVSANGKRTQTVTPVVSMGLSGTIGASGSHAAAAEKPKHE